jgi:L-2,4-diaminobutyrate decarboxylase
MYFRRTGDPPMRDDKEAEIARSLFPNANKLTHEAYCNAIMAAAHHMVAHWCSEETPTSGIVHAALNEQLASLNIYPRIGIGLDAALLEVRNHILPHIVNVAHPTCAGYLHCPPMLPSLAAEVLISATNQSLDSYDQGPSATVIEQCVIQWLCQRIGFKPTADGVFTSGGTQSNLMGLLLARDHFARERGRNIAEVGLDPNAVHWRIFCSEHAHFSIAKGAHVLGLGAQAVVPISADVDGVMSLEALHIAVTEERKRGGIPFVLVLTAGTTDFGAIDPLAPASLYAREQGMWVHIDAAVAGAFVASERLRKRVVGLALADSVTIDFHKLWFQSVSCGVFLVAERDKLSVLHRVVSYLDPHDLEHTPGPNLVGKSLQTTRRFDALKVWLSLRSLGEEKMSRMIERVLELAKEASDHVSISPDLDLLAKPTANIVLFRWRSRDLERFPDDVCDKVNSTLALHLWRTGKAVIGRTIHNERPALKLTFMNPLAESSDITQLLDAIVQGANEICEGCQP